MPSYIGNTPAQTIELADNEVTTSKIKDEAVTTAKVDDDAVTADKLANSINSEIAANTAKVTNATHTGEVTGSTALTIANNAVTTAKISDGAVSLAKLSATGTKDNTTFLRGDNTFQVVNTDVVSDTSPQLGGNLDVNGNDIVSVSNGDIDVIPNGTGKTNFGGNAGIVIPSGTTAQRQNVTGLFRLNSETNTAEYYDGSAYKVLASPPNVTGATPSTLYEDTIAGGTTLTIAGSLFDSPSVKIIDQAFVETTCVVNSSSSTQIVIAVPTNLDYDQEPYDIRVLNASGLSSTLEDAFNVNETPAITTSSGSLGSIIETASANFTQIQGNDPEGDSLTFNKASGTLPSGFALNSNGTISGTAAVGQAGTYNFTATCTDGTNVSAAVAFSITITLPATGGTITTSGNDTIHTFTSSGTFSPASGFSRSASWLIIAGGGGGGVGEQGNDCGGGGAGAGGYRSSFNSESSGGGAGAESAFSFSGGSNYTVTVGGGGSGGQSPNAQGSNGNNSSVFSKTSNGGGGGSNRNNNGSSGGSGGGCSCDNGSGGSGTSGQGYPGAGSSGTPQGATQGGGGAGGNGGGNSGSTSGGGGSGVSSSITGSSVARAGGGSGGSGGANSRQNPGPGGGSGGSLNGNDGGNGDANKGGGGGGAGGNAGSGTDGGNGGSGLVVIRYTI